MKGGLGKPITPRILSRELKDMTEPGLLHRTEYPVVPRKVEYALAPRGKALLPILSGSSDGARPVRTRIF